MKKVESFLIDNCQKQVRAIDVGVSRDENYSSLSPRS